MDHLRLTTRTQDLKMRLFIAINVPKELEDHCKALQERFPGLKKSVNFHLTLQFLGEVAEADVEKIIDSLQMVKSEPFEIKTNHVSPFPNAEQPYGVWIDCELSDVLARLANDIRSEMGKLGIEADKPFKPHITLGRYKNPPIKRPKAADISKRSFAVDRFYLIESKPLHGGGQAKNGGHEYRQIDQFAL